MRDITISCADETATARLAAALAAHLRVGDVLLLDGALAAGKTFFTKALVAALGSSDAVTSPTYAIANIYDADIGPILHVDAYRLASAREFHMLGLEEQIENGISVIEWGSRVQDGFDDPLQIGIGFGAGDTARDVTFSATSPRWVPVLEALT